VKLPLGINQEKVDATYHNGILTVTLLKAAEATEKRSPSRVCDSMASGVRCKSVKHQGPVGVVSC
jgi:Molecular chaperone (small heat shock protein)